MVIGDSATAKGKRSKRMAVDLLNQNQEVGLDWAKREKSEVSTCAALRFGVCTRWTRRLG